MKTLGDTPTKEVSALSGEHYTIVEFFNDKIAFRRIPFNGITSI